MHKARGYGSLGFRPRADRAHTRMFVRERKGLNDDIRLEIIEAIPKPSLRAKRGNLVRGITRKTIKERLFQSPFGFGIASTILARVKESRLGRDFFYTAAGRLREIRLE